jgi:hypothetical protein
MKITGRISLLSIALTAALVCATTARADSYTFSFTGEDTSDQQVSGTLTLTITPLGGGYYGITGVSGVVGPNGGEDIINTTMSYDWAGTASYGDIYYTAAGTGVEYDDILNLSGSGLIFDSYGLYMPTTISTKDVYFYSSDDTYYFEHFKNNVEDDSGTFTITPEPSTWLLLGSGLFALAGLAWKSRKEGLNA